MAALVITRVDRRHHQQLSIGIICVKTPPALDAAVNFCLAIYASAAYAVMRCIRVCPCVCLSVTFVHVVKTNKHIFKCFSPSGSQTIPYQTSWQYSNGASNAGGVGRNRYLSQYLAPPRAVTLRQPGVVNTAPPTVASSGTYRW